MYGRGEDLQRGCLPIELRSLPANVWSYSVECWSKPNMKMMGYNNTKNGFDLVGEIPNSGVYRKRVKPGSITTDELRRAAKRTRKAIIQSTRGSEDSMVDCLSVYSG